MIISIEIVFVFDIELVQDFVLDVFVWNKLHWNHTNPAEKIDELENIHHMNNLHTHYHLTRKHNNKNIQNVWMSVSHIQFVWKIR